MSGRIISKFGGTSMTDADAMRQSASVARQDNACIVVVSATSGTTDQLIALAKTAVNESFKIAQPLINEIAERHMQIASELEADESVILAQENLFEELTQHTREMSHQSSVSLIDMDEMMSFGERLSSNLMVVAMGEFEGVKAELLDARDIIVTDDSFGYAEPDVKHTKENARGITARLDDTVFVTQGFIGRAPNGKTTTLGRGGSDYSAALFAEAVHAKEVRIWTDVAGVATTDPRIVPAAQPISALSFEEAAELATAGANILHPPTMIPARRAMTPIFVGSTFEPEAGGTTIDIAAHNKPLVRAITLKKDQHMITITTPRMSQQSGFLARVFEIVAQHSVSIDQITTSEIAVAMTVDDATMMHERMFRELLEVGEVDIEHDLQIVSLIGNQVNHTPGLVQRIFDSLQQDEPHMTVRAVFQGASKHSVGIMVSAHHGKEAVRRLHKTFLEEAG